jgi:alanine racemase
MKKRATLFISQSKLINNYHEIKKQKPNSIIACCVKSNAYGLGLENVVKILANQDPSCWFCVRNIEEGIQIRKLGYSNRVLIISTIFSFELDEIIKYKLTPVISNFTCLKELAKLNKHHEINTFPIHLFYESGMNWLGFSRNDLIEAIEFALNNNLEIEGIATHYSSSDDEKREYYHKQIHNFNTLKKEIKKLYPKVKYFHSANSGALLSEEEISRDILQPGLILYGLFPSDYIQNLALKKHFNFQFIARLVSYITSIKKVKTSEGVGYGPSFFTEKEINIGVIPLGYYNGISRLNSNKLVVQIKNKYFNQVGNVSMNSIIINLKNEKIDDEETVTIFETSEEIDKIAKNSQTINYEIITNLRDLEYKIEE